MLSGHQDATAGSTDRSAAIVLRKTNALGGNPIDIGSSDVLLAVATEFAIAQVVGQNVNNVWPTPQCATFLLPKRTAHANNHPKRLPRSDKTCQIPRTPAKAVQEKESNRMESR